MINKIKLIYYKLIILILDKITRYKHTKNKYGPSIRYKMDYNILQLSLKYNTLYSEIYPDKIIIECLDACGLSPFEECTSNLTDNYTIDESEPLMLKIFSK